MISACGRLRSTVIRSFHVEAPTFSALSLARTWTKNWNGPWSETLQTYRDATDEWAVMALSLRDSAR